MSGRVTGGQVLRYAVLPGILPRVGHLFFGVFGFTALVLAQVCYSLKLLPAGHPCLRPAHAGQFGVRHVLAECANNLVFSRKNIDKIIALCLLVVGMILFAIQIISLFIAMTVPQARAQLSPEGFAMYFVTPDPSQDIASILLDKVFGLPDSYFGSCVSAGHNGGGVWGGYTAAEPAAPCEDLNGNNLPDPGVYPLPFHVGLHAMFRFYSLSMMVVGAYLLMYFIVVVVGETAQTGAPFGRRFNHVWAPIRLVFAFGFLVPIGMTGLNTAQMLTFQVAEWGSGLATNGWIRFNCMVDSTGLTCVDGNGDAVPTGGGVNDTIGGDDEALIARPTPPEIWALAEFFTAAYACMSSEHLQFNGTGRYGNPATLNDPNNIQPYVVRNASITASQSWAYLGDLSYWQALGFSEGGNILIRIGRRSVTDFPWQKGNVEPTCGELLLRTNSLKDVGALHMQQAYYNMVRYAFDSANMATGSGVTATPPAGLPPTGYTFTSIPFTTNLIERIGYSMTAHYLPAAKVSGVLQPPVDAPAFSTLPDPLAKNDLGTFLNGVVEQHVRNAWDQQKLNMDASITQPVLRLGWAGAGIWYNRIAEVNGAFTTAVMSAPSINKYPDAMQQVVDERSKKDESLAGYEKFNPVLSGPLPVDFQEAGDEPVAQVLFRVAEYWERDGLSSSSHTTQGTNIFVDIINFFLGTNGLFDMRYNNRQNPRVHPLAQLASVGNGLVNQTLILIGGGVGGGLLGMGGVDSLLDKVVKTALGAFSGMALTIASITMTVGFILYYVLPFMPFIYFYFSVGEWIKTIFEAMVGLPLWALAHIRIDGEGLPGTAAATGYYLILEIMLRPILTVFGLLASAQIFAAMVEVLNDIFDLVVVNVSGGGLPAQPDDPVGDATVLPFFRNVVDELFFTVLYAIIVYMMALSSFKLIDQIPDNILRWMGVQAQTFGDRGGDHAQGMIGKVTAATGAVGGMLPGLNMAGKGGRPQQTSNLQGK